MRVVIRVHDGTADGRTPAHVAFAPRLADLDIFMLDVADLADGCHAGDRHIAQFAGRQAEQRKAVFLRHQLRHDSGRAGKLCALAGVKFHIVDEGADRDVFQRKRIAGFNVRGHTGDHRVPGFQPFRGDDIAFVAVFILHQSDKRGAVRVVLNAEDLARGVEFLALEVNQAVFSAVFSAAVADRDAAVAIPAGSIGKSLQQALFRRFFG